MVKAAIIRVRISFQQKPESLASLSNGSRRNKNPITTHSHGSKKKNQREIQKKKGRKKWIVELLDLVQVAADGRWLKSGRIGRRCYKE